MSQPMTLHVHRARDQPATRYLVGGIPEVIEVTHPDRRLLRTSCCKKRRIAANLTVQSYYDGDYFHCKPGTGCRRPTRR